MTAARPRRAAVLAVVTCLVGVLALAGCSRGPADEIDYAVDGPLVTYNVNTVVGAASAGPQAFARVLTGFDYHGPEGQVVGDHDFGTIAVVGRAPLVLDYQISDAAVYSDGKPVTCDDMVLAWAAQSGRFPGFDAASRAGYGDVASVDCAPGQKKARVSFAQDRGFVDFGQLFAATAIMPSHVIADELGAGDAAVTVALQASDLPTVAKIAQLWNTTWNLTPNVDLKRFPSSGPYKLSSVRTDGGVVLVANDRWWGAKPVTGTIVVWPRGADVQDRVRAGQYDVVDISAGSSGTLTLPGDYTRTDSPSAGVEQLIFAPGGPLVNPTARRAVALCTPRDLIAQNVGSPIANSRLNATVEDSITAAESAAEGGQFSTSNPQAARDALGGKPLTVRVGYQSPNARLAATVGAIAKACQPAGITVQDVASEQTGPQALRDNQIDALLASTGERRAADPPGPPPWMPTTCSAATATTCRGTRTRRSTGSSARWP